MSLAGLPSNSPIPVRARQFAPASGTGLGASSLRPVVLIGNMLAGGTETIETLGGPIQSLQDCYTRFGQRSEISWMYRAYTLVDQQPLVSAIAVATGVSATASTCSFPFVGAATVQTVINIDSVKGRLQVLVNVGDTAVTIATNVVAAINADPDLPFSAAIDNTNAYQVDITTYPLGPRSKYWIAQLRMSNDNPANATTMIKSSVTAGSVADSVANAIVAVDASEFTYHALACTSTTSVTSTDGGVGQWFAYIASIISPSGGKSSMAIFAVDGTSSQATAVTQSAVVNSVFGHCYRVLGNDWHPAMVSAHHTAIHRSQEVNYAAAKLAGWTPNANLVRVYSIPDPFVKTNRPTSVQEITDLNGGVSTVGFRTDGTPYIVRSVTCYSWIGSSTTGDYRAREGHYPSVLFKFWEDLVAELIAQDQPNFALDPPQGGKMVAGFMYPKSVTSIGNKLIADMTGSYQANKALLDPSILKQMLAATNVDPLVDGYQLNVAIGAVRHNLQDLTYIAEISPAY